MDQTARYAGRYDISYYERDFSRFSSVPSGQFQSKASNKKQPVSCYLYLHIRPQNCSRCWNLTVLHKTAGSHIQEYRNLLSECRRNLSRIWNLLGGVEITLGSIFNDKISVAVVSCNTLYFTAVIIILHIQRRCV